MISTNDLYGGSYRIFTKIFEDFGIGFHFVDMQDPDNVAAKINAKRGNEFIPWKEGDEDHHNLITIDVTNDCRNLGHHLDAATGRHVGTTLTERMMSMEQQNLSGGVKRWKPRED